MTVNIHKDLEKEELGKALTTKERKQRAKDLGKEISENLDARGWVFDKKACSIKILHNGSVQIVINEEHVRQYATAMVLSLTPPDENIAVKDENYKYLYEKILIDFEVRSIEIFEEHKEKLASLVAEQFHILIYSATSKNLGTAFNPVKWLDNYIKGYEQKLKDIFGVKPPGGSVASLTDEGCQEFTKLVNLLHPSWKQAIKAAKKALRTNTGKTPLECIKDVFPDLHQDIASIFEKASWKRYSPKVIASRDAALKLGLKQKAKAFSDSALRDFISRGVNSVKNKASEKLDR